MTILQVFAQAVPVGFESYATFNERELDHEILTCTKGQYNGEVIDVYYDLSGTVTKIEQSTQFKGQQPTFKFKA